MGGEVFVRLVYWRGRRMLIPVGFRTGVGQVESTG